MVLKTISEVKKAQAAATSERAVTRRNDAEKALHWVAKDAVHKDVYVLAMEHPEDCALTSIGCEDCVDVPLIENSRRLVCPSCGRWYEHVPGAGAGPLDMATVERLERPKAS